MWRAGEAADTALPEKEKTRLACTSARYRIAARLSDRRKQKAMSKRTEELKIRISPEDKERIKLKMEDAGILNLSAYVPKMGSVNPQCPPHRCSRFRSPV